MPLGLDSQPLPLRPVYRSAFGGPRVMSPAGSPRLRVSGFLVVCALSCAVAGYSQEAASTACPSAPSNGAAPVCVMTHHNSNARTGLNPNEQVLTPSKLQSGLTSFTDSVTGQVYGQPLFLPAIKMADGK